MSMFAIFAYGEPVHRAAVLAEYYLAHWLYALWTDAQYLSAITNHTSRRTWLHNIDVAVAVPLSMALAVTCTPGRVPLGLLDRSVKVLDSLLGPS
eukprot:m.226887 g.226887  ORF g.226887 m.226887 type:complete len:95 (+) comp36498_c0_seq1:169-453(+)